MVTHLEPDILECEVKWALGSITRNKASGGDGIPVELFQILKDDALKVLHSICQQILKTQYWVQDWKMSIFIPIPKKGSAKECSNYCTIALISHASKVILKIVQARLQLEKAMATHSSTLAWKIPWMEEPGRLQSMGSLRVGHNFTFTFMHWRGKCQSTPVFLPGESHEQRGKWATIPWDSKELDMTK